MWKAKTLVRLAYKAFQMNLLFEDGGIEQTSETLARSHRKKFEEMGDWDSNPFKDYIVMNREFGGYVCVVKQHVHNDL